MWSSKKCHINHFLLSHLDAPSKQLLKSHNWATYYNLWHPLFRLFQDLLKESYSSYQLSLSSDQWGLSCSNSLLKIDSVQISEVILPLLSEHLHVYFLCLGLRLTLNLTSLVFFMLQWCHDCYLSVISTTWIMLEFQTGCGGQCTDKAMNKYMYGSAVLVQFGHFYRKETHKRRDCCCCCSKVCIISSGTLPVLLVSMNGTDCISVDGCHYHLASCVMVSCD